jgi:hypothetical protein
MSDFFLVSEKDACQNAEICARQNWSRCLAYITVRGGLVVYHCGGKFGEGEKGYHVKATNNINY